MSRMFGMYGIFGIMVPLIFILVISVFIINAVRGVKRWNRNNQSPRLTVPATVVAKRTDVARRGAATNHHHSHTYTSYYATFQFESGDRLELELDGYEYGMLVEGDQGNLTFQGTRYLGFDRTR